MKALTVILGALLAFGAQAEVSLLGSTKLSMELFDVDTDQIDLGTCRGRDRNRIQEVQIRVRKNDIYLESVVATFGNGQTQEFRVRKNFREGSQSRWIDLRGHTRCIRSFRIVGRTVVDLGGGLDDLIGGLIRNSARVELWGRRGHQNDGGDWGGGGDDRLEIRRLAARQVKFGRRGDFQRHRIFIDQCRVKEFRIKSRNGRFKVRNFQVHFRNGDVKRIGFRRDFFRNGDRSVWKEVRGRRGRGRCIEKVTFGGFSPNNARIIIQGR